MTRITQTPQGLTLIDRPVLIGIVLIVTILTAVVLIFTGLSEGNVMLVLAAGVLALGAGLAFRTAVRRTRLVLRPDGSAQLSVRDGRGETRTDFATGTLRAGLNTDYDDGESHRAVLLHDTGGGVTRYPFTTYSAGGADAQTVVDCVMDWHNRTAAPDPGAP